MPGRVSDFFACCRCSGSYGALNDASELEILAQLESDTNRDHDGDAKEALSLPSLLANAAAEADKDLAEETAAPESTVAETTTESPSTRNNEGSACSDEQSQLAVGTAEGDADAKQEGPAEGSADTKAAADQTTPTASAAKGTTLRKKFTERLRLPFRVRSSDSSRECGKSIEELAATLPPLQIPKRKEDMQQNVPEVSFEALVAAIEAPQEDGLLQKLLKMSMGCYNIRSEPWDAITLASSGSKATCSVSQYTFPPPADIPDVARRIVSIPAEINGTTVTWFTCSGSAEDASRKMVMRQRCSSEGVMYSDRTVLEFTIEIIEDASCNGVRVRQWVDTVWLRSLPWTHNFLVKIVESKVKSDAVDKFPNLLELVKTMCSVSAKKETEGSE